MKQPLPNSIAALAPELAEWRQDIHRHPELGYEETRTAAVIAERLRGFGVDAVATGVGKTGVVATLHGQGGPAADPGDAILIRADMDALPIQEETGLEYASQNPGRMHACGHDGHTTMLLGAAKHLAENRNFKGTVHFVFQPAEEGGAGAKAMIEDGLFERFPCRMVFGMHNWPNMPLGKFAVRSGPVLASADEFSIEIQGQGGHAAKPDGARDPLVAGAHLVAQLQTIVSRRVDPLQPAVLSVTRFQAGSAFNIIPDRASLSGTVRSFDEGVHAEIYEHMDRMTRLTAEAFQVSATLEQRPNGYPPVVNDAGATEVALATALAVAGEENVLREQPPTMGAEDFAFMAREKPGCFVFIGNGESAMLHHPKYNFNDEALPHGVALWSKLVEQALPL